MPGEYKYYLGQIVHAFPDLLRRLAAADWLALAWWIATALAVSLLILAADGGTGSGLLRILPVPVAPRFRPLAALATGIAAQGLLLMAAGFAGVLNAWTMIAMLLPGAAGVWWMRRWPRPRRLWWLLPILALLVLDWLQPVAEFDSTMYHMAAARLYRDTQSIPYDATIRFNAHPQLTVLFYLRHWLLTGSDTGLKLFNLELLVLLGLALWTGARELRLRHRWLPVAFAAASPVAVWVTKIEYADLALSAFTTTAGVFLLAAVRRRSLTMTALAAVALGCCGAFKLQGLVVAAAFSLAFLLFFSRPRRLWWPASVLLAAGVVLFGAGWWWRSWLATGSPAFPFFTPDPDLRRLLEVNTTYGFGRDFFALLRLPWRLVVARPVQFGDAHAFGPGLILLLAAAPLALRRRETRFLWTALSLFFGFWFFSGQVTRYWACTIGLQGLVFASAFDRWGRPLGAMLGIFGILNLALTSPTLRTAWPPPATAIEREAVQSAVLPYGPAMRALNAAAGKQRVYLLFAESAKFHVQAPHGGGWYGADNYFWAMGDPPRDHEVLARLRSRGYRFVLVEREGARAVRLFMDGSPLPPDVAVIHEDGRFLALRLN